MVGTARDRVLIALDERDVSLPEDGLTLEKIRERAFGFQFESDEALSFRIERHPTMYLSDMGVPGLDAVNYADWMGTKHLSAIEVSVREEVVAAITLSEENGRMSIFEDGDYDDYQRDELGDVWRPTE